jgi:hypothetical protein
MWVPTGGPKGFVAGKTNAKCVFNHAFARRQQRVSRPLNPLLAMRRQYQELSGSVEANPIRKERTDFNVEMIQRRFGGNSARSPNYNQVFHSFFSDEVDFESNFESFNMEDHVKF